MGDDAFDHLLVHLVEHADPRALTETGRLPP